MRDKANVMTVFKSRVSCRNFTNKEIPKSIIDEMLESARLSPSGGNGQNWVFGIIKDRDIIDRLSVSAGNQDWIKSATLVIALCTRIDYDLNDVPDDDFGLIVNQTRYGKEFIQYMNQYPDRKMANVFWNNANTLIPGEHMLLTAAQYGISGCFVGYMDILSASTILDLPEDMVCLYLLPLGYPAEDLIPPKKKKMEEIVFYDKW